MQFELKSCDQFNSKKISINKDEVDETRICPIIQQSLDKIIKNQSYTSYKIITKSLSTNGGNYLGDLVEIDIKGETKDGGKESNIFIKHIIPGDSVFSEGLICITNCYINEVFMYNEIKDVFVELNNEADVPNDERLRIIKTYDCNNHIIVLENLSRKGFRTLDRMDLVSLEFAEDSIEQLARLHALSFALESKKHNVFENIVNNIKPVLKFQLENGYNDTWTKFITSMVNVSFNHVKEEYKDKKDFVIEKCLEGFIKYFSGKTGTVKCLCHGDFRINNILMKDNVDGGVETILIDYQFLNYGSPILDILFFLYSGTDTKFRNNHMEHIKDVYHNTLTKSLNNFDIDINEIYPRSVFEKDFEDQLDFGLVISVTLLACFFTDNPDFFTDMEGVPKVNDKYRERINETFGEFVELGLL